METANVKLEGRELEGSSVVSNIWDWFIKVDRKARLELEIDYKGLRMLDKKGEDWEVRDDEQEGREPEKAIARNEKSRSERLILDKRDWRSYIDRKGKSQKQGI